MASEDIPNSLADAEKLLNQHQQLKDEIDAYAPEYAKMKDFGEKVTEGQEDPQYMFLRQVSKLSTWVLYICVKTMTWDISWKYVSVYMYIVLLWFPQRLQALDSGWEELLQMWENRQQLLSQSLNLQVGSFSIYFCFSEFYYLYTFYVSHK